MRGESTFAPKVATDMSPVMKYVLAPNGEIVKVVEGRFEYTGMFILER